MSTFRHESLTVWLMFSLVTFCACLNLDLVKWQVSGWGKPYFLFLILLTVPPEINAPLKTLIYIYGRNKKLKNKNDKFIHCLTLLPE